jgi:hypothetical protein
MSLKNGFSIIEALALLILLSVMVQIMISIISYRL